MTTQTTTQSSTSSTYTFVPSTAAVATSAELYIAWVLMQGMTSYTNQLQNMLEANLSFAESSAEDMKKVGDEQLYEAIAQGAGEMFSGAMSIGGAAMSSSFEEPQLEQEPPAPNNEAGITENPEEIEMTRFDEPTDEETQQNLRTQQEHQEQVKEVQQRNKDAKETAKANNKIIAAKNQQIMGLASGIGQAGKAIGDTARGVFQRYESQYQAAKTLADNGQQNAKGMFDQFMQMYNSSVSSLNTIYQTIAQIAQANNMR